MENENQNPTLWGAAVITQVALERLKVGQVGAIERALSELSLATNQQINGLSYDLTGQNKRVISKVLTKLKKKVNKTLSVFTNEIETVMKKLPTPMSTMEKGAFRAAIGNVKLNTPKSKLVFSAILNTPMGHSGELVSDYLATLSSNESKRIINTIKRGVYQGRTNQQIVREVVGTRPRRFNDGTLATFRRNATAVTFTAIQHAASVSRMKFWEANGDVVEKYRWVSTLDSRTTTQCRSLDGRVFEFGQGPVPPIHTRCRSTTIAVLNEEYEFLSRGRTRSGEFGPVPANQSYYDWLKSRPASYQNEVLGATRAKLFRDGGMTAEKFADLNLDKSFRPMSLDEMRSAAPSAFEKAGL